MLERLAVPIVQAPMLGVTTAQMVLDVSRAGGLGSLPVMAMEPDEIETAAAQLRAASDAPFALNLFVLEPARPEAGEVERALQRLRPWYEGLGLEVPAAPNAFAPDFEGQFAAVVRAAPPVASFTFGCLRADQVRALHERGVYVVGTATSVPEARAWAAVGADAVCAQGLEAGGHRGTFLTPLEESLTGTLPLVAAVRRAVSIPVLAAGGIMDGRGVAAALALGAVAAQMGTAFLLADEAATSAPWRAAVEGAGEHATRLTRAFSGRWARGIENRFMREMAEGEIPPYPIQNRLTQPLRAAAAKAGDPEALSLWAGQGVSMAERGKSADLVRRWWAEAREAATWTARRTGA